VSTIDNNRISRTAISLKNGPLPNIYLPEPDTPPEGHDPETEGAGGKTDPAFPPDGKAPGRTAAFCTRVSNWQAHLSGRLRKKLVMFDRRIAEFRKGEWS
jgi:hypothetical protein